MAVERITIGSRNPGKVNEWMKFLREFDIEAFGLWRYSYIPKPDENAATFLENARIKASWYAKLTGSLVVADDGGYEIDYLDGWPGVKSRRILAGEAEGTDQELIDTVLEKMKGVLREKRTVSLTSAAALSDPDGKIIFEDIAHSFGYIAEKCGPVIIPGYPFRSIHHIPELNKTYAELTEEELKNRSHKRPVTEKLAKFLAEM